ncbi:hypothetical protein ACHQM5_026101 [Ranunculus cassubicifolius]
MERVSKVLILCVFLAAFFVAEGAGRKMKEEKVAQPQNVYGSGGIFTNNPSVPPFMGGFGFSPTTFCTYPGFCVHSPPVVGASNEKNGEGSP